MLISYCDLNKTFHQLQLPPGGGIFGYDPSNFVVLDEMGISSMHMRLTADGDRLFVEDLQSLNGTMIKGRLISEKTELRQRGSVLIGCVLLRFEKNCGTWFVTAVRQDDSMFSVESSSPVFDTAIHEENATAVTVIASNDIKEAIKTGDSEILKQTLQQSTSPAASVSFDAMQELGKYKLMKKIGKGGMGVVFLAKHKVMNTYRALKLLPHSIKEENYDFFERFMREARIASEIRHPNIVGVMDAETDPQQQVSYIVMEFIDGGTLRRILKSQKVLPEIQALLIVRSVAEALKAIAEHKIIHRDIKPDNIMFTRHGEVKLADLGIAKNEDDDITLTRNNMMIGTPAYLSPEQIETPKDVDIRSDIYSLGATLYEMLTGTTPYAGENTYAILQKMISEPIVNPRKKNPAISSITAKVVLKMLQKNPAKRYQSPQALLETLNRILPHYPNSTVQNIIRGAVMGTGLPPEVKPAITSGPGATLSFAFFRCRQSLRAFFSAKEKSKTGINRISAEKNFSFQLSPEVVSGVTVDFTLSATPGKRYKVQSENGFVQEYQCPDSGKLEMKSLTPGKYKIFPGEMKNS